MNCNTVLFAVVKFLIFLRNVFFWYYYKLFNPDLIINNYTISSADFEVKYVYRTHTIPYVADILGYLTMNDIPNSMRVSQYLFTISDEHTKIFVSYYVNCSEVKIIKDDIVKYIDVNEPIDIKFIIDKFIIDKFIVDKFKSNNAELMDKLQRLRARRLQAKTD